MKVVVNAQFLTQKITGVQRYAIEISKELKLLLKDKIKFVAPRNIIHHELAEYLEAEIIGKTIGISWEHADLRLYLQEKNNPILLNMCNMAPIIYKRNIVVLHDVIFLRKKHWFCKKFHYAYRYLTPILLNRALKIVTVSNFSKYDISRTFEINPEKIEVAYNALPEDFKKYSDMNFENQYGDYILAIASHLNPRKNLPNIIKAFNMLQTKNVKLVVVGAKIKHFSVASKIYENELNDNIIMTGYIGDKSLIGLYKNAKFLAFPSLYEGFGIPPIEAMSTGCPVLTSNVTSLPEVCGDAAYYVNPYNVSDIASGMDNMLNNKDLRDKLIKKGYERLESFSWKHSAYKLVKIIDSIEN